MSVCPSVTSRYFVKTDRRIELVFRTEAFFDVSYNVFKVNSGMSKNKGTFLRRPTVFQTLDVGNFATARWRLQRLARQRWTLSVKQTMIVGRNKLTALAAVDVRPTTLASLSYWASTSEQHDASCGSLSDSRCSFRGCSRLKYLGWGVGPSSPKGSGKEPQWKSNFVHRSLKTWHLVTSRLLFFSENPLNAVCQEYG